MGMGAVWGVVGLRILVLGNNLHRDYSNVGERPFERPHCALMSIAQLTLIPTPAAHPDAAGPVAGESIRDARIEPLPSGLDHVAGAQSGDRGDPPGAEGVRERFLRTIAYQPTRQRRRGDIDAFFDWCACARLDPLAAERGHIERWRDYLQSEHVDGRLSAAHPARATATGVSTSLLRSRLSAVSLLMEFAIDEGSRKGPNAVAGVARPPAQSGADSARWLSLEEVGRLLASARAHGPLPHAVCRLLIGYGQLSSHLHLLRAGDLYSRDGEPYIRLATRRSQRVAVRLGPATLEVLRELGVDEHPLEHPMFSSSGDAQRPLSGKQAAVIMGEAAQAAGLARFNLWVAKHTFCALARHEGVSERALRDYTGCMWSGTDAWERARSEGPPLAIERLLGRLEGLSP